MTEVRLTTHAVQRYVERVRPTLDLEAARADLERLVERAGEPVRSLPWKGEPPLGEHDAYLELCEGVALVLEWKRPGRPEGPWLAVTAIVRGVYSDHHRAALNAEKARRRAMRRGRGPRRRAVLAVRGPAR